ncbi:Uncharacterized protein TCM_019749 [Theobroma cacao]|uniref:Replication protein A OB domain-containing protein n=1 Tax=Theobroma cacao TaxID=3641 RepID=A0A061EQ95_THECC|nr:Uncharacterized protein TCM_019749 [Theobroma cacao]
MECAKFYSNCPAFVCHRDVFLYSVVGFDGELKTVSQKSVDVFIPSDFYNLRFLNPNTNGYYTSLASTSQIQNSVAFRNSKRKLGYNTVESSSYIQNVEQDCRNSQRRNIVSFEIDHRDDDNFFEQELSLASDASQMLPILNDEDNISTFNQQTAHIGTSFVGDNSTSTHFDSNQYNIPLNLGGPRYVCCFYGAQMWYEERKNKSRNERNPRFTMCCMEGKVSLPPFKQTPSLLATLLNYKGGRTAYKFRHNIRVYNSMFQFTSIGGKIDSEINRRPGPYVFKINGQNHHKIGSLLPVDGERPKFAQLYIYDTENEVSNRINALGYDVQQSGVEENIVKELMEMLDQTNQIVKAFRMAKERFKEPDYIPVKLRLIGARMNDGQQYTNLISSEVAALIVGDVDQLIDKRDIIIEHRSNGLRRISDLHPAFMPMQYPLLFPYGEDGFHLNIPYQKWNHTTKTKRGTVTAREFYVYMLQFRLNQAPSAITITSKTKIVKASSSALSFQRHYFQFLEFEHLPHRYKINETLTDIIGLIISMSKVTAIYVSNKSTKVPKRNLQLQNIKGTIINATLWGDLAYCVDDDIIGLKSKPIIILAAMTVGEYQGQPSVASCSASKIYVDLNIPIVADMKARFDEKNAPVLLLDVRQRPQIPPDQQENHNRVTIKQLLQIDHSKTQIETYTCIAKIKEFDCTERWYYIGCKICMKTLQQISDTFWCPDAKHGEQLPHLCYKLIITVEDNTGNATFVVFGDDGEKVVGASIPKLALLNHLDKYILPEPITKLIDQEKLFSISLVTKSLDTGNLTFRINSCKAVNEAHKPTMMLGQSSTCESTLHLNKKKSNLEVQECPPSSPENQIQQDLFPEESPIKKVKLR